MAIEKKRRRVVSYGNTVAVLAAVSIACWMSISLPSTQLRAATTERIVTDYHTGLAINGFDPVAYFTNGKAMIGQEAFEARHGGAIWRFINAGNRAAFIDNPEVYMPVFGGYDPMGVARGIAVAGYPEIWLIVEERLYLFRSQRARAIFASRPEQIISTAQAQWPTVLHSLAQ